MKGLVLHFKGGSKAVRLSKLRGEARRARGFIERRGAQALFVLLFLMGLVVGAACEGSFDPSLFDRLDFLFVTNIKARLGMSAFGIFLSCFVSYFMFVFALLLLALSAWGFAAAPVLTVFKGFSVGLSSAFVFAAYRGQGIGFYILVVLPGAVMFLFTLVRYSIRAFRFSLGYARLTVFGSDAAQRPRGGVGAFVRDTLLAFLFSCACAVTDMLLWVLFADKFHLL